MERLSGYAVTVVDRDSKCPVEDHSISISSPDDAGKVTSSTVILDDELH